MTTEEELRKRLRTQLIVHVVLFALLAATLWLNRNLQNQNHRLLEALENQQEAIRGAQSTMDACRQVLELQRK